MLQVVAAAKVRTVVHEDRTCAQRLLDVWGCKMAQLRAHEGQNKNIWLTSWSYGDEGLVPTLLRSDHWQLADRRRQA